MEDGEVTEVWTARGEGANLHPEVACGVEGTAFGFGKGEGNGELEAQVLRLYDVERLQIYERLASVLAGWHWVAMAVLLLRRLAENLPGSS